jgi:hypothetical protein
MTLAASEVTDLTRDRHRRRFAVQIVSRRVASGTAPAFASPTLADLAGGVFTPLDGHLEHALVFFLGSGRSVQVSEHSCANRSTRFLQCKSTISRRFK